MRIFGGSFAPRGWAKCEGQLLAISQNTALFSLLGTTYGGDGRVTFGLPNFQGAAPMQQGQGPGLSRRDLGQTGGEQTVTLLQNEMPAHAHAQQAVNQPGEDPTPGSSEALGRSVGANLYQDNTTQNLVQLAPQAAPPAGGSQPHNNMPPYLTLTFILALQGIFPQRPQ
jgi:microcystin-dependent protein